MKNIYHFLSLVIIFSIPINAQIPNAGFEEWSTDSPVGWSTNNIPSIVTPISQTNSSRSGYFALKGEVESFSGIPYPPIFETGSQGKGFAVSQRHASLTGYYKFNSVGGDIFALIILMQKNGTPIGGGSIELGNAASYTLFDIPIEYYDGEIPDSSYILGVIGADSINSELHIGSQFYLDDLSFQGINSAEYKNILPENFALQQNYPNPFNPSTTIKYQLPVESKVTLTVYNMLGQVVKVLVDEIQSAGYKSIQWDASGIVSGLYFYRLQTINFTETKKLLLMK